MTDTSRLRPDPVVPQPLRIGLLTRFWLGRQGRLDGRRAIPDPVTAVPPVTTPMRSFLESGLDDSVRRLWADHSRRVAPLQRDLDALGLQLPELRADASAAADAVRAADAGAPAPDDPDPQRRLGEQGRAVELIRSRRRREHDRATGPLRDRLRAAEESVRAAEERVAHLRAEIGVQRGVAGAEARRLRATFECMRDLYDRALVDRHPQGHVLRPLLDRRDMQLPEWARDGVRAGAGEQP
jgi:hypothetical protein